MLLEEHILSFKNRPLLKGLLSSREAYRNQISCLPLKMAEKKYGQVLILLASRNFNIRTCFKYLKSVTKIY